VNKHLIASFAPSCPTAADLISKMSELWGASAAGAADLVLTQVINFEKDKEEDILTMFNRFEALNARLPADQRLSDQQQLNCFLTALPPEFNLDVALLRKDPKSSLSKALTGLLQTETQLKMQAMQFNSKALYTSGYSGYYDNPYSSSNSPGGSYRNQQQQYSNQQQQRPNHHQQQQRPYHHHEQQQQQFESPDSNGSNRGSNRGFSGTCNYCKERGHMKRDCPKLAAKNQNNDMKKQLDDIQSRLHALLAALPPSEMSPVF
jgi:hypothetical protein